MDFIFHELVVLFSSNTSWNMKSVRQGKVWFWLTRRSQNHAKTGEFLLKRTTLAVTHNILINLGMFLRPSYQPKPHFPLTYGLHIPRAVRGKKYCELVEYEVRTSTESVDLRENTVKKMKSSLYHLL